MFEMQGGEGGGMISKDICILQSIKVLVVVGFYFFSFPK